MPDQACSTACSTRASQLWPAWTTTATPPQESSALTVNPSEAILQHRAGEPVVGNQQVGAAADDQQRLARGVGGADGVDDLRLGPGFNVLAGGAADSGRGQVGEESGSHPSTVAGNPENTGDPRSGQPDDGLGLHQHLLAGRDDGEVHARGTRIGVERSDGAADLDDGPGFLGAGGVGAPGRAW